MVRTQIYLTDAQRAKISQTGKPMATFIREAVDAKLADSTRMTEDRLDALTAAAGAWKNRNFTGDEYQVRMRKRRAR